MAAKMLIAIVLLAQIAVKAQTTAPAQDDDPLEALRVLIDGVETGRPDQAREMLYAEGAQERRLAASIVELASAVERIRAAAREKFGAEAAKTLRLALITERVFSDRRLRDETPIDEPLTAAQVLGDTDRARIHFGDDSGDFVLMRRIDGKWKLAIDDTLIDPERPSAREFAAAFSAAAQRMDQLAAQISGGAIASVDEATAAMRTMSRPSP